MAFNQQFEGKKEFQDIILNVMEKAAMLSIEDPGKFSTAVESVRDLMEVYADEKFLAAITNKGSEQAIKSIPGGSVNFRLAKHKFRELVKLFGRSGFIPAKLIGGEIDEESVLALLHETGDLQPIMEAQGYKIVPIDAVIVDKKQNKKA